MHAVRLFIYNKNAIYLGFSRQKKVNKISLKIMPGVSLRIALVALITVRATERYARFGARLGQGITLVDLPPDR